MTWDMVPFKAVLKDATGGNIKTKQSDYLPVGSFPIVDQGKEIVGGYSNNEQCLCKVNGPVIIFGDHTKILKFIDFNFCLGADGTKVLKIIDGVDAKYIFYALQRVRIPNAGYSRHFKFLKEAKLPLPPLHEQRRIVGILDQTAELVRLRREALEKLDMLGQAIFHDMFGDLRTNSKGFQNCKLGDLITVSSGRGLIAKDMVPGEFPVYGGNGINGYHNEGPIESGRIIIGRVGVYCGSVHLTKSKCWVTDNALLVTQKASCNTAYLSEALKLANLNQYAGRSSQPLISGARIYEIPFILPPEKLQERFESVFTANAINIEFARRAHYKAKQLLEALGQETFTGGL